MVSFKVNDVPLGRPKFSSMSADDCLRAFPSIAGRNFFDSSITSEEASLFIDTDWTTKNPPSLNGLIHAVHTAFASHYPLVLSPDIIWITLLQGLGTHIGRDPEKYRDRLVNFKDGTKEIVLTTDTSTPWIERIQFADIVREYLCDGLFEGTACDFTTSTPTSLNVSRMTLLNTTFHFFTYVARTMCGIPSITLLGTEMDWVRLKEKTQMFKEFGLEAWVASLNPILDQFISTCGGRVNTLFWRSIYKYESMSGGDRITGWITNLFPDTIGKGEVGNGDIPSSITSTPFIWRDMTNLGNDGNPLDIPMAFHGGLVGVIQDHLSGAVTPLVAWAITDR